jgi:hypothetical protein
MNYTIKSLKPMGEAHEVYGQRYWGYVEETIQPIMFNSKGDVSAGDKITCESQEERESKSGNKYLSLKKVRKSDGAAEQQTAPVEGGSATMTFILNELKKQTALLQKLAGEEKEVVVKPDDDVDEVDLGGIPF